MADLAIMVAPNGARKGPADHPNLPITIEATVKDALECQAAGAQAIHLHVRDDQGKHSLDASRYLAATEAVRKAAGPDFPIQITTEAVGMFKPHEQIAVVKAVKPEAVSIATKELIPDASEEAAAARALSLGLRQQDRRAAHRLRCKGVRSSARSDEARHRAGRTALGHLSARDAMRAIRKAIRRNSCRSWPRFRTTAVRPASIGGSARSVRRKRRRWLRLRRSAGIAASALRTASSIPMAAGRRAMPSASRICGQGSTASAVHGPRGPEIMRALGKP